MKINNLNALITGGSLGLGRAVALGFLREGANVCICARNAVELQATRDELAGLYPLRKVVAIPCDVSDEAQVNRLWEAAKIEFGVIHALVLNAGVYGPMGPTETVDLKEWRRAMDINLYGVLLPCRVAIPHFRALGSGKIIIMSGGGATNPLPNISAYAASKAATVRLMETLAEELKPFHIDVNAIAPGALATRLIDEVLTAGPERVGRAFYEKNLQWKKNGATPVEKGADLAVYLASGESDGITGRLISAQWDHWQKLHEHKDELAVSDIYCLRRIVPEDRAKQWL